MSTSHVFDAIQTAVWWAVCIGVIIPYRSFLIDLFRFMVDYLVLSLILVAVYILVYAQTLRGMGLPYLIWHEEPITRLISATGATLLLGLIGVSAYYLIPEVRVPEVMGNARRFLRLSRGRLRPFLRWLRPLRWLRGAGVWLVPTHKFGGHAAELSTFLRLVRLPFLTLLALPALLPGAAPCLHVPRSAPVHHTSGEVLSWIPRSISSHPDVNHNFGAWLLGALIWTTGIGVGVLLVKLGIKASPWIRRWLELVLAQPTTTLRVLATKLRKEATSPDRVGEFVRVIQWFARRIYNFFYSHITFEKQTAIATFYLIVTLFYLSLSTLFYGPWPLNAISPFDYRGVAPGLAIFALLGLFVMVGVALSLVRPRQRFVLSAAGLLWIASCNCSDYGLKFEGMSYDSPRVLTHEEAGTLYPKTDAAPDRELISNVEALEGFKSHVNGISAETNPKPKMVVVTVTGGAARSGFWSAVVLDRLDQSAAMANFHDHIRIIAGASGGMVGAACYVDWLGRHLATPPAGRPDMLGEIPTNSLEQVARYIALRDPLKMMFPKFFDHADRGIILERDWKQIYKREFAFLRKAEREGAIPSLIFSPMSVDDGRRLLISNLDLRNLNTERDKGQPPRVLAVTRGGAQFPEGDDFALHNYSLSAIEYFKVFRDQDRGLKLSTAARMSASFPFVSPAVSLPSSPPLRMVDAGYYDNYGVDVASAWIMMNREWITENTSGIVMVQIRDSISREQRLGYPKEPKSSWPGDLAKGFQLFTSVMDGVAMSHESSAMFRNDAQVATLNELFTKLTNGDRGFFTTIVLENTANVSIYAARNDISPYDLRVDSSPDALSTTEVEMSWYLTSAERLTLRKAIPSEAEVAKHFNSDRERLQRFDEIKARAFGKSQPASKRRYFYHQYERALNYERIKELEKWWLTDHSPKQN